MPYNVLLVDDHPVLRQGIGALLASHPDFHVVGEAPDGRTAIRLAEELDPDLVVMDIAMPDLNGIEATRAVRGPTNRRRVVCLSANRDRKLAIDMLRAGALGYVAKDAAFEELLAALRAVADGKVYVSSDIANAVFESVVAEPDDDGQAFDHSSGFQKTSRREREVLQLIAEGRSTKEVARHLELSVKTVETHRRNLMEKLQVYTVAELTRFALREGITSL